MKKHVALLAVPLFALVLTGVARAEEHEEHGGKKEEIKVPDTFAGAVAAIEQRRDNIKKEIADGKLDALHHEGEAIKKIAESLAKLATKDESVAKTDLKEINLTAKALASKYEPLDEAGDGGKKEEAQKVFDEMVKLIDTLKKFVKAEKKDK